MKHHSRELSSYSAISLCALALALPGCGSAGPSESAGRGAESLIFGGVSLQTVVVPRYLSAANNGGGAVTATATSAQGWEAFLLEDLNGGSLLDGDHVTVRAGSGQYFQALNGGGSSLNAASQSAAAWEIFTLVRLAGPGTLGNGDVISLQSSTGNWVSAQDGGGSSVSAAGTALSTWEQFRINGLPTPSNIGGVSLRTATSNTYLSAANGGGSTLTASATAAQAWETFSLVDLNGGSLESGDNVHVRASNGQFLAAVNGGGSGLTASSSAPQGWETFKLVKRSGSGIIYSGDVVGLQSASGAWVSAQNGGWGSVLASAATLDAWESFTLYVGATPPPVSDWRPVWADEFNGTGVDLSKWSLEQQGPGWVNNELQTYTSRSENARVEGGHLVIEARNDWFQGTQYSSARLKTQGHASFTYGRMEAMIQLPGGWGTWPAFWMMPDNFSRGWPACGEIDVMEEVGFDQDAIHGTTHSLAYNFKKPTQRTSTTVVPGVTAGFHLYAVEWYPDRIDFFVDGRKYYTSPNDFTGDDAWPFNKNFYVILNLAVGGDWGGSQGVDPNIWPRRMLVDYVRVYQK